MPNASTIAVELSSEMIRVADPHHAVRFARLEPATTWAASQLMRRINEDCSNPFNSRTSSGAAVTVWCDALRAELSGDLAEDLVGAAANQPLLPACLWDVLMDFTELDVTTASRVVRKISGPGTPALCRRLFAEVLDPSSPPDQLPGYVSPGLISKHASFTAAALAYSSNVELVRLARTKFKLAGVSAELLPDLCDALVEWLSEELADHVLSRIEHLIKELRRVHGHRMVQYRPCLAEAFAATPNPHRVLLGRPEIAASRVRLPAGPGLGGLGASFEELVAAAAGSDAERLTDVVTFVGAGPGNESDLREFLAVLIAANRSAPDALVRQIAGDRSASFHEAVMAGVALRSTLSAELAVFCELRSSSQGVSSVRLIERCDNPALAVAKYINTVHEVGRPAPDPAGPEATAGAAINLVERGLWATIDVATLRPAAWMDIRSVRAPVPSNPVADWTQQHLATSPARWRLSLELLPGFEGTFGDLAVLCAAAED